MQFIEICRIFDKISKTSSRIDKTRIISEFISGLKEEDIENTFLLLGGSIFHPWENINLGISTQLVIKSLSIATGYSINEINREWKNKGDLGLVSEELVSKKRQNTLFKEELSLNYVIKTLKKIPYYEGKGSTDQKVKTLSNILTSSEPIEARYIIRIVLEDLRIGLGEGTIRDSIAWSLFNITNEDSEFKEKVQIIQEAYDKTIDFGEIFRIARKDINELKKIRLKPGKPTKVMLYLKAKDFDDAFERVGLPCAVEYKYDGFRLLIHKYIEHHSYKDHKEVNSKDNEDNENNIKNNNINYRIKLFTRRLEDVTEQFPDVVDTIKDIDGEFILDSEIVGYNEDGYLPFQNISQRIKRKHNIRELSERLRVEINVFDIVYYNGRELLKEAFIERRKILEKLIPIIKGKITTSKLIIANSKQEAIRFYEEAIRNGLEGVMAKNLNGIYKPGARVGYGVKIKPTLEPIDGVIVKAEWGEGKRGKWLSSYTIAIRDNENNLLEIGKVSSGLKETGDESFEEITKRLETIKISEEGKIITVKPEIILEVQYEEIQKSPTYSSGFALRFPRIIRIRDDKPIEEITSIEQVNEWFIAQKKISLNKNNQ